ncbi:MAG TPA: quinone-dependent dihydroorotate dehydrogenase, partial [Chitinophagaceae bacterium]|nr:quinone-dependent dihydroorotate dehydrogenase [Chitinophagaceae bacterium]
MIYSLAKKFLFQKDAEEAHYYVMDRLKKFENKKWFKGFAQKNFQFKSDSLSNELWGLKFKNPVGLAAGFDKDAKYIDALAALGFGFIEIGTLTPRPQDGNPKPRLFRLPKDKAVINRMGFNNGGVDAAVERLKQRKSDVIIGGNIGKNKDTPNEEAINDYEYCFRALYDYVDYFTVNVSSPNTPNLRELQDKEPLQRLLTRLQIVNTQLGKDRPILLKIAPDLTNEQLDDIIEIVASTDIDGIVATNTTIDRNVENYSSNEVEEIGAGGLSGKPVREKSTTVIKYLHDKSRGAFPIIAAGGIFTAQDAQEKIDA